MFLKMDIKHDKKFIRNRQTDGIDTRELVGTKSLHAHIIFSFIQFISLAAVVSFQFRSACLAFYFIFFVAVIVAEHEFVLFLRLCMTLISVQFSVFFFCCGCCCCCCCFFYFLFFRTFSSDNERKNKTKNK